MKWRDAIKTELKQMKDFKAWREVSEKSISKDEKIIDSLCVFTIKSDGPYKV